MGMRFWIFLFLIVPSFAAADSPDFSSELQTVIQTNLAARSQGEWLESRKTPEALFARIRPEIIADLGEAKRLCLALGKLSSQDLALFEEVLSKDGAGKLPCTQPLLDRLERHWTNLRLDFELKSPQLQFRSASSPMSKVSTVDSTLPNEEKHIDTAATPYLIRGELKPGEIAFTFDDGPHPTRTARVLKILSDYGVRANFFEIGQNVQALPQIAKQVVDAGHLVCNHSWSHPLNMTRLSMAQAEAEFDRGRQAITDATGTDIPFFRFPGGNKNTALVEMVKSKGFASFYWTMDTRDWQIRDPEALYANVLKELNREKGGIILFHDVHEQTVLILPRLMQELRARNFTTYVFVPH